MATQALPHSDSLVEVEEPSQTPAPIPIRKDGEIIGYFTPRRPPTQEQLDEFAAGAARLHTMLAESGLTGEELLADFERRRAAERH